MTLGCIQPSQQKTLRSADTRRVRDVTGYESYFAHQTLNKAGARTSRHAVVQCATSWRRAAYSCRIRCDTRPAGAQMYMHDAPCVGCQQTHQHRNFQSCRASQPLLTNISTPAGCLTLLLKSTPIPCHPDPTLPAERLPADPACSSRRKRGCNCNMFVCQNSGPHGAWPLQCTQLLKQRPTICHKQPSEQQQYRQPHKKTHPNT